MSTAAPLKRSTDVLKPSGGAGAEAKQSKVYAPSTKNGEFVREDVTFRDKIEVGGKYPPEANRYHLYVSYACPWASRTLVVRAAKGLSTLIGVSVVEPHLGSDGWTFAARDGADAHAPEEALVDHVNGVRFLRDVYSMSVGKHYDGRVTVPVLFDTKTSTIVNNESSEIIRMLNTAFDGFEVANRADYYPAALRREIDAWNELIYPSVNNGVYRCGFATTQAAYDAAYDALFATLGQLEAHLAASRYLCGSVFTEADIRLFVTLVRFDPVYHNHFRCNKKKLCQYPALWNYTLEIAQMPFVTPTINIRHIKEHYYGSHLHINPSGIVPRGPDYDLAQPHNRAALFEKH